MQQDTRLARLLHVLIHMHLRGGSTTSETIAQMLHTNPALVRRTMAALRDAGYVDSGSGPGGGWRLACALSDVTVEDVYIALSHRSAFSFGLAQDNATCPVEAVVNQYLTSTLDAAQATLLQVMGKTSLSDLAQQIVLPSAKSAPAPRDQQKPC
jgi:DNA-binding IscR family transcriptional regulator